MRKHPPPQQKMLFFELELKNPVPLLPRGTAREQTTPEKTDAKKTGSTSAFPASSISRHPSQPCTPSGASVSVQSGHSSGARYRLLELTITTTALRRSDPKRCPRAPSMPFHINCCTSCPVPVCTPRAQRSGAGE